MTSQTLKPIDVSLIAGLLASRVVAGTQSLPAVTLTNRLPTLAAGRCAKGRAPSPHTTTMSSLMTGELMMQDI
jgi:hypothetical protein